MDNGYEVESHCTFLSENDQEKYTETTSKVLGESILDEDPPIVEVGIVADMDNNTDKADKHQNSKCCTNRAKKMLEKKLHGGIR